MGVKSLRAAKQTGVEFGFGNIEAQSGLKRCGEDHRRRHRTVELEVKALVRRLRLSAGLSAVYNPDRLFLDTIRLRSGEAARTGAVLTNELVVSSRWRFTRLAASIGLHEHYYSFKRQAGG